jgi:hypothetical protein
MFDSQREKDGPEGKQVFASDLPESGEGDAKEPEGDADVLSCEEEDEADGD